jgi:hypothetical protein
MKRFLSLFLLLVIISYQVAFSQEADTFSLKSKKGVTILPEKGDYALGIDATPFFYYLGGLFSNNGAGAPYFTFTAQNPGAIYVKKMLTDRKAVRIALRIGYSQNRQPVGTDPAVDIKYVNSAATFGLQVALENAFLYKSRIRGYYGAGINFEKKPYQDDLGMGTISYKDADDPANDWTRKGGIDIGGGLGAILGVEVFIAPKVSLAGEFNVGFMFVKTTDRVYSVEGEDDEIIDRGSTTLGFDNTASGSLVLSFYF